MGGLRYCVECGQVEGTKKRHLTFCPKNKAPGDESQPGPKASASEQSSGIDATLQERGKRYGKYKDHALITQELKHTMHVTPGWSNLAPDQKETLEMIAHKIGRILNGDPNYHDSWHDIVGYAKLSADLLLDKSQ